jgi:hypothetical protein
LIEPQDAIAAHVAPLHACSAAPDSGRVEFSGRISGARLVGQRGNRPVRQKIGFDCAPATGDRHANPIDRSIHRRLIGVCRELAIGRGTLGIPSKKDPLFYNAGPHWIRD